MSGQQRYRLVEKVDVGGMAEIYRAQAITVDGLEKTVAIKRILPSLASRPKFVKMFLDEARLSMMLNHANIVHVFDVGFAQGTYFMVMEFVDGPNLRWVFHRAAERNIQMPVPLALFTAADIVQGLAHAHELCNANGEPLHIVHRDVNPANVLISQNGEVKLTDFGLAKALTQAEITDPGIVKGKYSYLSPEAAEGNPVDHRADLFSTGIVLWELLAGRRLFLGKTEMECIDLVQKTDVPLLTLLNPDVPEDLDRLVRRALVRDPKKRFQTAREMGESLTDYLFSHGLKVTNYDLANFIRSLAAQPADQDDAPGAELIHSFICNEIRAQGLGALSESTLPPPNPSPIDASMLPDTGEERLTLDDISPEGEPLFSPPMKRPPGQTLADLLEGKEVSPIPGEWRMEGLDARLVWVLIGLSGLAGLLLLWKLL